MAVFFAVIIACETTEQRVRHGKLTTAAVSSGNIQKAAFNDNVPSTHPPRMNASPEIQLLLKVAVASILGGIVGLEREASHKPAGFRTHLLVAGGAAFLFSLSEFIVLHFGELAKDAVLRADPIRIVEAIVMGVSFLGAGTIFRHTGENHIEGLTTAASLLFVAAIGISVSLGLYLAAIGSSAFVFIVLIASRYHITKRENA